MTNNDGLYGMLDDSICIYIRNRHIYTQSTPFTHPRHMQHMNNIQHLSNQTSSKTTQSAIIGARRHRTL